MNQLIELSHTYETLEHECQDSLLMTPRFIRKYGVNVAEEQLSLVTARHATYPNLLHFHIHDVKANTVKQKK